MPNRWILLSIHPGANTVSPLFLNSLGIICTLGHGKRDVARALFAGDSRGMQKQTGWVDGKALTVGAVNASLPAMPPGLETAHSRNNQLLLAAALDIEDEIGHIINTYGAERIGVVLGTSTSGIAETETAIIARHETGQLPADYRYARQEISAPAVFLGDWLKLSGPCYSISTACTSSARALISAARLLRKNLCDAVLVGGVDSLCKLTLNGFSALGAIDPEPCQPFSQNRNGINIGEAAALFIMTKKAPLPSGEGLGRGFGESSEQREKTSGVPDTTAFTDSAAPSSAPSGHLLPKGEGFYSDTSIALLGYGASSDAHHMSAPRPDGAGALAAMQQALTRAGLQPSDIDYLNLHGTATAHNDEMESRAVAALFPQGVACSSTKPLTGHTLGAAGALEAAFCWLALSHYNVQHALPPQIWDGDYDFSLPLLNIVSRGRYFDHPAPHRVMSNSFAFGGNNVSLILGSTP